MKRKPKPIKHKCDLCRRNATVKIFGAWLCDIHYDKKYGKMKTAINQLIKWIWLDFFPNELVDTETVNKIDLKAKELKEVEKDTIIKAFNSGRLCEELGMDKSAEEYFDETFEK